MKVEELVAVNEEHNYAVGIPVSRDNKRFPQIIHTYFSKSELIGQYKYWLEISRFGLTTPLLMEKRIIRE